MQIKVAVEIEFKMAQMMLFIGTVVSRGGGKQAFNMQPGNIRKKNAIQSMNIRNEYVLPLDGFLYGEIEKLTSNIRIYGDGNITLHALKYWNYQLAISFNKETLSQHEIVAENWILAA